MSSLLSVQRVRGERHAATIDRLLDALDGEIDETGLPALSVRAVAKAAGVSAATAYTYFGSLEHMVTELFSRMVSTLPEVRVDRRFSPSRRTATVMREIALLVDGRPELAAAVTAALFAVDPDVAAVRDRIGTEFALRIRVALADTATVEKVETLSFVLTGALVYAGTGHGTYADVASRLESAVALVLGGRDE